MILVDTSILIDFLRGRENEGSKKFEEILQRQIPFGINEFIFQEILQGACSLEEYEMLKRYLEKQKVYRLNDSIESYAKAARIYFDCRKKGITIRSTIDCLIAQTALEHDLMLLHNDADFYSMSPVINLKFY